MLESTITSVENFYLTMFGGIVLLVFFVVWIVFLVKTIFTEQESRLQKEYGTESHRKKEQKKKKAGAALALSGILLFALLVAYIFLL